MLGFERDYTSWYDACYFAHECGRPYQRDEAWFQFFGHVADRIVQDIQPRTVLDAGCAMGFLVECLRERGVDAYGIDVSEYAIQQVHPDVRPYCAVGSIAAPLLGQSRQLPSQLPSQLPRQYDLIVCMEVLEHMPPKDAEQAIANFAVHTEDVLFSSSPLDYAEATHINVHPGEYWAALFVRQGFFRDLDFDGTFITPWTMRFIRQKVPVPRLVQSYERKLGLLWKENRDLRKAALEQRDKAVAELEPQAWAQREATYQRELKKRDSEIARLRSLVRGYEQGLFIRFMRWLKRQLRLI